MAADTVHDGGFQDLLDAIELGAGETPAQRAERALREGFALQGLLSPLVAARSASRFVQSVLGAHPGETPEDCARRLGCSPKSLRRAQDDIARLASSQFLNREQFQGEVPDG